MEWSVCVSGVRCGWVECGVVCMKVHKYGFVMECRTANPSPYVTVSQVHLATHPLH